MADLKSLTHGQLFDYWEAVEKTAMHFNDLIIRIRLQALGGAGLIAGFIASKGLGLLTIGLTCLALSFVWIAIWTLDVRYYMRLLYGAVEELKRVEEQSPFQMSTRIEETLEGAPNRMSRASLFTAHLFYSIIFALLFIPGSIALFIEALSFYAKYVCAFSHFHCY